MSDLVDVEQLSTDDVVDPSAAEAVIEAKELGAKLRKLRLKTSMGLVELGERTGLSASYLSQLETGRVVPTLRNLSRIALAHQVDLSLFFKDESLGSFRRSREKDRVKISVGPRNNPFMLSQSMSVLIEDRRMVPCIAELLPGIPDEAFDAKVFNGLEFAYVTEGAVSVTTEQHSEWLDEGDVLWVDGRTKRQYRCASETSAKVMITSFPQQR